MAGHAVSLGFAGLGFIMATGIVLAGLMLSMIGFKAPSTSRPRRRSF